MDSSRATQRMLVALVALAILAGLLPLLPVALVFRFFHSPRITVLLLGVLFLTGLPGLLAWRARPFAVPFAAVHLTVFARWAVCLATAVSALVAVALTAQAVRISYLVAAQANTLPYALLQPVAFAVFAVAVVVAVPGRPLGFPAELAVWPRLLRQAALGVCALGGTTLFLSGGTGPALPVAGWLALKAGVLWLALIGLSRGFRRFPEDRRLAIVWAALLVGLANVAATAVVLGRPVTE